MKNVDYISSNEVNVKESNLFFNPSDEESFYAKYGADLKLLWRKIRFINIKKIIKLNNIFYINYIW